MEFNSSIIKGLPPKRSLKEICMAKGHLQSHERNGKVECMVTGVMFYSTENRSQRVVVMMTEGKVSRRLSVSMAPGATGFDHSML